MKKEPNNHQTVALPDYDKAQNDMLEYQFCYAAVMVKGGEDLDILMTELARKCQQAGLEKEFCIKRLMHNHMYAPYEVLVRRCFNNVYRQAPLRHRTSIPAFTLNTELLEHFLTTRYLFRRNCITGGVEFIERGQLTGEWTPLRKYDQNTVTINALREGIEVWDKDMRRFMESTYVEEYDPIDEYLRQLPQWDGEERIEALALRVPTDNSHWPQDFHVWFRAMVAQWMQRDLSHGNAIAPLIVGRQGDGKSTFCRLILPEALRPYYTDRIDFSNKNDAERFLTRYALINLDEYDSITRRQSAFLKHILQKTDVKSRNLYETVVEQRRRYANFIGTTNDPCPLTDPTGSRRFICIRTTGVIDTKTRVNYPQLYAQAVHEINCGARTWFGRSAEARIQEANAAFQQFDMIETIFYECFRHPRKNEQGRRLSTREILEHMHSQFKAVRVDNGTVLRLGKMLVSDGFAHYHCKHHNGFVVAEKSSAKGEG